MIPKVIHYCWFGGNPLPESAQKCIASWRKFLPDYEIKEWNESNFNVNAIPYTAQAYAAKKYAFVSDYARFSILYDNGGLYFDTDVEVIRPMDDIIENGPFMGFEIDCSGDSIGKVNPGLGMGAFEKDIIYHDVIAYYNNLSFYNEDGSYNINDAVVNITTRELIKHGLTSQNTIQNIKGIFIYPSQYFNPLDDSTGKLSITQNTHTIHWYSKTWMEINPIGHKIKRYVRRVLGTAFTSKIKAILKKCHL